jgi:hypothetical protein
VLVSWVLPVASRVAKRKVAGGAALKTARENTGEASGRGQQLLALA